MISSKRRRLKFFFILGLVTTFTGTLGKINAQSKVGIQAGYNLSSVLMKTIEGNKVPAMPVSGFQIGLTADIPIGGNFFVQPVLEYVTKGFTQDDNYFFGSQNESTVKVSYLQLPVSLIYQLKVNEGKLYVGSGLYAGYGIGGQWKASADVLIGDIRIENNGDVIFKSDFKDGEFDAYLYGKPWELGSNLLVGYQFFNLFKLQVNNQLGISNLQPESGGQTEGGVLKNRVWSVSLAYSF